MSISKAYPVRFKLKVLYSVVLLKAIKIYQTSEDLSNFREFMIYRFELPVRLNKFIKN